MSHAQPLRTSDKRLIKNAAASLIVILALAGVGYATYSVSQSSKTRQADILGAVFSPTITTSPTPSTTSPSPTTSIY